MDSESNRTHNRYAEFRAGLNNKFYEVEATEQEDGQAVWLFRWGRIGSTGQTKEGKSYSYGAAKDLCDEQFRTKLEKGYVEVTAMQAIAAAAQDVEDRPVNGLPPIEVAIPDFGAGSSESRCRAFAQKYLDKMNLIRKSKNDLGKDYYDQILSVIESFRDEWKRMRSSQSHRLNLGAQAEEGFKAILIALREFGIMGRRAEV